MSKPGVNRQYQQCFEGPALETFRQLRKEHRELAQLEFTLRQDAEQRKRQPKAKKSFKPLPAEWIDTLRDELLVKYNIAEDDKHLRTLEQEREENLERLAPDVVFDSDPFNWYRNATSHTGTYRSQGYGMHSYAKAALKPMLVWLKELGFVAEIRWKVQLSSCKGRYDCGDIGQYELWSNAPDWQFDAAQRRLTFETASKAMGRTVNPQVFNPFLTTELVQKHYAQSY